MKIKKVVSICIIIGVIVVAAIIGTIFTINTIREKNKNEYNIYMTSETLQTLLASLNMANHNEQQGYIWTKKNSTVNMEKVKVNLPKYQISEYNGDIDNNEFMEKVVPEAKEYIKNVIETDKNAYFHLYIEEDKFYLELELLGKFGLSDDKYDVTIYTNGTLSYERDYEMTKANKYERFKEEKAKYEEIVKDIKNGTGDYNDYPGSFMVDSTSTFYGSRKYNFDYMYLSTLRKNITYKVQYPEMIKFEDEQIAKEMEKANIEKIVVQEEYEKLTEEQKKIFFENINFDKEMLDKEYFTEENGNYLVVTGTHPFYGNKGQTKEDFERILTQVNNDYKEKYTLLYKPHPRALPDEKQEEFLNSLNIKILPGSLPMEAISFVYPNLKLGGYESSLYMSVDEGKTLFLFAKDKDDLFEPLNEFFDTIFKGAKLYN